MTKSTWSSVRKGQLWEWRQGDNWMHIRLTANDDMHTHDGREWMGICTAGSPSGTWVVGDKYVLQECDMHQNTLIEDVAEEETA